MSVVKSKRGEGKLLVITRANELAAYTIKICSNEKNFPKRYRWCISNKLVEAALSINNNIVAANSVYVADNDEQAYNLRRQYQTKALAETYALLSMIDIAYRTFGIESGRVEFWTHLAKEVQALLRNWRKSESK
ncbi:four helix bundle protein [Ruminococcus sp.]|uniref:four helix bundle protein n=1 Tax=Ruminococcus sp. TaxID=41978 RepID=UPI0025D5DC7E|nr:four helix bundle protein [Ruminococcus sp.]MBQ8965877.1 four helix bundle protein [Ruminococcus sp.]